MDENVFYTEDMEYKIRITKKKKFFTHSDFGQYDCTIEFYNSINLPVLVINCNEKELYLAIQRLSEFNSNMLLSCSKDEISTIINFDNTGNMNTFFWYVTTNNIANYPDNPTDEDIILSISIYSSYMGKNALRIYLPMTYSFLDVLIYNIYLILEDLPYLDSLNNACFRAFMRGEL